MSDNDINTPPSAQTMQSPATSNRRSEGGFGCMGFLTIGLLLLVGLAAWMYWNNRAIVAYFAERGFVTVVENSMVEPEEKAELIEEFKKFSGAFREKKISYGEVVKVIEKAAESPFGAVFFAMSMEAIFIERSGLTREEKTAASRELKRLQIALVEEKLSEEQINETFAMVTEDVPGGHSRKVKNKLSDEELRAFFAEVKMLCDQADIAQDPETIDISAEFRQLIKEEIGDRTVEIPH